MKNATKKYILLFWIKFNEIPIFILIRSIWIAQKYSKNWNNGEWLFTMHVPFISLINSILENVNKLLTMLFVKILMSNFKI